MQPDPWPVVLLPGAILPAELAYGPLVAELGDAADAHPKGLEIYAGEVVPPPGYRIQTEVDGILSFADEAGFETFHLVGYSLGGAVSLAFTAAHPERLRSLALFEPAWAGRLGMTNAEAAVHDRLGEVGKLPASERMGAFVALQLADDVEAPPSPEGPPPPWMASRVKALESLSDVLDDYEPDWGVLRAFRRPVYFALGGRSNPDLYARTAERLRTVFPDFTLDTFAERHHFDPPQRIEPGRLASALRDLWQRAG
ncbi:MAG: alpha/beta fold hydrolase [Candidatus Limnocylindria bacterium]